MKKLFGSVFLMAFLISACGAKATATPVPPTEPPPTQSPFIPATVVPPTAVPSTQTPINPSGCTDSASFVEDVTVPDHTNFNQGDVIHKVWRVKNTGTCAWNGQYALVFSSGDEMSAHSSTPLSATKPGDTLDIALDLVAPSEDGSYRGDFEIDNPSGAAMPIDQAKTLWVAITVGGATTSPTSSGASTSVPAGSTATSSSGAGGPGLVTSTCAFTTDVSRVNDVITAINAYRAQNNLPPYNVNTQADSGRTISQRGYGLQQSIRPHRLEWIHADFARGGGGLLRFQRKRERLWKFSAAYGAGRGELVGHRSDRPAAQLESDQHPI